MDFAVKTFRSVTGGLLLGFGLFFTTLLPVQAADIVSAERQIWDLYQNPRFGVRTDVPRIGFFPQLPPDNGDGQTFKNASGDVEITVYGSYWTAMADRFSDYKSQERQTLLDMGAEITYQPSGNNWFVFSGYLQGRIFYMKATTRSNCPVAGQIYFLYPVADRKVMGTLVEYMENSFSLGPSADCPGK
jgi:hypothetical protein